MEREPSSNDEVCTVTGGVASARFDDGLGWAWEESRYDLQNFVDLSGTLDGAVCDDVIETALREGRVVQYGWQNGRDRPFHELPADAAALVFAASALRRQELVRDSGKRTPATIGTTSFVDASGLGAPRWLAPVAIFQAPGDNIETPWYAGALYAMTVLATGGMVARESAIEAGREMHAFVVAAKRRNEETDKLFFSSLPGATEAELRDEEHLALDEEGLPSGFRT